MKKYILFGLLMLIAVIFLVGYNKPVGEQGEEFFVNYLSKYLSKNYIDEHFKILKIDYDSEYDKNCYTYQIKFGEIFAHTGSGIISDVNEFGSVEFTCFKGRKILSYTGPKKEFELNIRRDQAEKIMQENGCVLISSKGVSPLYIGEDSFSWWGNKNAITSNCEVNAETGEFTISGWEPKMTDY